MKSLVVNFVYTRVHIRVLQGKPSFLFLVNGEDHGAEFNLSILSFLHHFPRSHASSMSLPLSESWTPYQSQPVLLPWRYWLHRSAQQ
jgi:hypothetical protein